MNAIDQVDTTEVVTETTAVEVETRHQVSTEDFLAGYLAEVQDKGVDAAGNHRATLEDVAEALGMKLATVAARVKELRKKLEALGDYSLPVLNKSRNAQRGRKKTDASVLLEIMRVYREGE